MPDNIRKPSGDVKYIINGGALIHRIGWKSGKSYEAICQQYCRYVGNLYGTPVIVFDGYQDGPSTKDAAQRRRASVNVGATVELSGTIIFRRKKDSFLSNKVNKHRFIALLRHHLEQCGCYTDQARADADLLIVQTTIAPAEGTQKPIVLVGDDTDLLVLLWYLAKSTTSNIYLKPEPKQGAKQPRRYWHISSLQTVLGQAVCKSLCLHMP